MLWKGVVTLPTEMESKPSLRKGGREGGREGRIAWTLDKACVSKTYFRAKASVYPPLPPSLPSYPKMPSKEPAMKAAPNPEASVTSAKAC